MSQCAYGGLREALARASRALVRVLCVRATALLNAVPVRPARPPPYRSLALRPSSRGAHISHALRMARWRRAVGLSLRHVGGALRAMPSSCGGAQGGNAAGSGLRGVAVARASTCTIVCRGA